MKTAIVTGTTLGVGRKTVTELSNMGYKVIATSRDPERIKDLESENVYVEKLDTTNFNEIKALYEKYKDITLDILVNNAAGAVDATNLVNEDPNNFTKSYMLNVSGPMYLTKLFTNNLAKSENSTVIFISSFAGKYLYTGQSNYTNSKSAVSNLADLFRLEYAPLNIKVTEICPATINTREDQRRDIAMTSEDIVSAIIWVCGMPKHCNINFIEMAPTLSRKYL